MEGNSLKRIADDLVELAGGYNPKGVIVAVLVGLATGFLLGGLLGSLFGFWFFLFPLLICLAAAGVVGYMKFRREGGPGSLGRGGHSEQDAGVPVYEQQPPPLPQSLPQSLPLSLLRVLVSLSS